MFAVFTVALVTYLTYIQAEQSLLLTVDENLSTIAALKVDNLNRWVDEQQGTVVFLSSLPELRMLTGKLLNPDSTLQEREASRNDLTNLVTLIAQRASDFRDIQILDLTGKIVISVSPRNNGISQAGQPFFEEGQKITFVQDFYRSDLFDGTTLTVATPLFNTENKRVGVLALHLNMKLVDDIVNGSRTLNEAIQSYLIDSDRRIITNDPIVLSKTQTLESIAIDTALGWDSGSSTYINHNGIPVIGNYQWIKERDVALIVEINEETALFPARRLAISVAITGILFSLVLVIAVTIMAGRITAPLRALTQTVSNISEGDLNALAPVLSDDEVGTLAQAFNSMTAKLRQTLAGLEKELHDREKMESALRQSEERYRTLFEGMQDGVYRSTHDGRFIDINPSMVRIFGYDSKDEMLSVDIENALYFSPEERENQDLAEEQEKVDIFRMRRKDGSEIWVEDHGRYVKDPDGNIIYHEGLLRDITERVQAENAIRDSEQKFRTIFESSPIAICITALDDGRLIEANYAYWDLMGYDPVTSIGKTPDELKLWDMFNEQDVFIQTLISEGSFYNPYDEFLDEQGNQKQAISFYRLVQIGGEQRIISMFYDMSTQIQTMQALQQSEARVRALLEAIPDMIMEISREGLVINVIPPKGMEESMPPANRFVGTHIKNVFSDWVASQALVAIDRSLMTSHITMFEFEEKMGREVKAMEARVVPHSMTTVIMMIRDITQRKWVELERESLIQELESRNRESETLRKSLANIITTFDIEEVTERILDQIKLVIPYDTASVWRIEGEWQILFIGRDLPPELNADDLRFRIDAENSSRPIISGEKKFVLNNNVQAELSDFKGPHSYINSWLAVPLRTRGHLVGLITLDGRSKDQFNEHHAELAVTFADQVAIALDNANLFVNLQLELEQRRNLIEELKVMNAEAETLRESLASIVGTFEFSEIIHRILDQIKLVVPYDSASIWRLDGKKQTLIGERGLPGDIPDNLEFLVDEHNHATQLFMEEKSYIINHDVQSDPDFSRFHEHPHNYINSWLGVPLKTRGKFIGLIALDGKQKNQFNEHHAQLAVTFAGQVAIALENADLFSNLQSELEERKVLIRELERKNAEAETLRESTAVVAATLEIKETVHRILEQIKRVVQYDSASVWLYKENHAFMMGSNGLPPGAELPGEYLLSEKEPDYAFWRDNVPYILLDDIQEQYPDFRKPPKNYIHSWLTIPLLARGDLIGFISLDSRTPGKFTPHDAELALTFASQVSIALENARLFTELQSELDERRKLIAELELKNIESETLRESTAIVAATLEKEETVDRILEQLERVVPYDSASVQLVDGNVLEIVSTRGFPISELSSDNRFEIDENEPAYMVLSNTVPYVLFDDVQLHFSAFTESPHDRIHAWMAVPLKMKGKVIGIIALDGYTVGQFSERHARLAVTYANQVAIALENARLYSNLQVDLAIRQNLISELESKNAELERFTYTVSHDLKSPLFTIRGFLGYLEQDALTGNRERMRSDMQRIIAATEKMQQLLNDLLELSRIGRLMNDSVATPFGELVREAVELVQGRLLECGAAIHIDAELPVVYGDRPRLLEVVQNLVDNAAKFMGNQPEPRIEIGWDGEKDGMPILYVRDNGMGIPLEHHERIFGLFNKLDVKADGTGVGLALVKRIIEFHGGRIWVESKSGEGATFFFTLRTEP